MIKISCILIITVSFLNSYAQFNDPLFNLSVSKSTRLKKEKAIVDSVTTLWYNTLQEKTQMVYKMPNDTMPVFDDIEIKPEYEGGMYQLIEYIERNKPKQKENEEKLIGLNIVKFIISDKGEILAPQIVYSDCEKCETLTIKIFNEMPRWIPGKQYDIPVYVFYTIPIFY